MARVVVVNDDTTFLSLMRELLELEGHETIILREVAGAFERLTACEPDLAIIDIRLNSPETGWQLCEVLKLDPRTAHLPLIVCSAAIGELRERAAWLEGHNIGTLPKPFDIDDLYDSVRTTLETGRAVARGL